MQVANQLTSLVEAWLVQQRWFGGKGRDIDSIELRHLAQLGDTALWVAHVRYVEGSPELYQVPLVSLPQPVDALEHTLIGTIDNQWIYDALHDKEVTGAWLAGIRDELSTGGGDDDGGSQNVVRFHRTAEPDEIPVGASSLVLTGEQSNTSLVFGDAAILKVFRHLSPGVNPDIEVLDALTSAGGAHIARLLGHVSADIDGEHYALAMLQEFLTTATDGWELARTSVRDLMAEADLHPEEAGGDLAAEAERLGGAVAGVHADLAAAFGTQPATAAEMAMRASAMHSRLEAAIDVVPELASLGPRLRALYDAFAASASPTASTAPTSAPTSEPLLQRIHDDLHLGQALRTARRWVIIDFEGEPSASLTERRRVDSVLRDIAGMLRSFDYAARHWLLEVGGGNPEQLAYRATEWVNRNQTAFLDGYATAAGSDPRDADAALRAYEADKAVYEAVYEARHRPSWLPIPLAALAHLTEAA